MKKMISVALALTAFACAGASVKKQDSRVGPWAGEGFINDGDSGTSRTQVTILYVDPMGVVAP